MHKGPGDETRTTPLGVYLAGAGETRFELHVVDGAPPAVHPLKPGADAAIGRSPMVEIRIDHPTVSRRHALLQQGPPLRLIDLGSQNGTRVADQPLSPNRGVVIEPERPFVVGAVTVVIRAVHSGPMPAVPASDDRALRKDIEALERDRIVEALARAGGNQSKAAKALGISRRTLATRLAVYAIPRPRKP